jgi:hypothetical protein
MERLRHVFSFTFVSLTLCLAPLQSVWAQGFTADETGLTNTAGAAGYATEVPCRDQPGGCIPAFIGTLVNALLGLFGSLFLVLIMWGGVQYMFAGGDEGKVKKARQTLQNAILGMLIVIASYAIASFVLDTLAGATGEQTPAGGESPP